MQAHPQRGSSMTRQWLPGRFRGRYLPVQLAPRPGDGAPSAPIAERARVSASPMISRVRTVTLVAVALGCAGATLPAAAQDHAHDFVFDTKSVEFTLQPGENREMEVRCDKGEYALFGGVHDTAPLLFPIIPKAELLGRNFYKVVVENEGSAPMDVIVFVDCRPNRTKPAADDSGVEHEHKIPKPRLLPAKTKLPPASSRSCVRVARRSRRSATATRSMSRSSRNPARHGPCPR